MTVHGEALISPWTTIRATCEVLFPRLDEAFVKLFVQEAGTDAIIRLMEAIED